MFNVRLRVGEGGVDVFEFVFCAKQVRASAQVRQIKRADFFSISYSSK
jgi:hypothetical protein